MKLNLKMTPIEVLDGKGTLVIEKGVLVEGDNYYAISDLERKRLHFISTSRFELGIALKKDLLRMRKSAEDDRHCSECGAFMLEGFCFESDGTIYCGEKCLMKVISWKEYLAIHDDGNGDAYWTEWEDL